MSAVEVTINGVMYDKKNRTVQNVVIFGEASLTGLGVGGGPIIPPETPGNPPGIWGGGNEPFPTPPIVIPKPPVPPVGIWPNPPEGIAPHPEHPIVLPPNIVPPDPPDSGAVKPPPEDGGWGYFPEYGWGYFPKATEPGPK